MFDEMLSYQCFETYCTLCELSDVGMISKCVEADPHMGVRCHSVLANGTTCTHYTIHTLIGNEMVSEKVTEFLTSSVLIPGLFLCLELF